MTKGNSHIGPSSIGPVRVDGQASPRLRATLLSALALLAGALFFAAPAFAKEVHVYKSTFGTQGSGPGQLNGPTGIAVNDTTHEVYVVDSANNRVEDFAPNATTKVYEYAGEFNGFAAPTGAFSDPTEIAVDNSSSATDPSKGDVYVVDRGHNIVDKFSASGTYEAQLTGTPSYAFEHETIIKEEIKSVAVDPSGKVWLTQSIEYYAPQHRYKGDEGFIDEFNDAHVNEFLTEHTTAFGSFSEGLAVDNEDNLYLDDGNDYVKVNRAGETLANPFSADENPDGVATDPSNQEVFLDNDDAIGAFGSDGERIESFGQGYLSTSQRVAVDASDGMVYASDKKADDVVAFEEIALPSVGIVPPSERTTRSVTLNATVNPKGQPVKSCAFEYDTHEYKEGEAAHGTSVPCSPAAGGLGEGTSPVPVSAKVEGLAPEMQYYYRLVAQNEAPVSSQSENEGFFTGPKLGTGFVTEVTSSSAMLQTSIDSNGAVTEYRLEYGTGTAYEHSVSGSVGSGTSAVPVSVHLQTLAPSTTYHYLFVAAQDGESFAESDRTFRTQSVGSTTTLIDGRSWELVSPASKKGALIEPLENGGQVQAASDGTGIAYTVEGGAPVENPAGKLQRTQLLSERGPDGWSTQDLTLPQTLPENEDAAEELFHVEFEYMLFSPDLSSALVEPQMFGTPLLSPEATERTLYIRNDTNATFAPLVSPADVPPETKIEEPNFDTAFGTVSGFEWQMHVFAVTPDLGHVVFDSPMALTPEALDEENIERTTKEHETARLVQRNLYEWNDGTLQLVNILPGNEKVAYGRASGPIVSLAGTEGNAGLPDGDAQRAVSNDGQRIAWTWGNPYNISEPYKGLYVRDMVEEKTVRVGGPDAIYQTMNSEGSEIFYLENGDLYGYDWETGASTDLTAVHLAGESSAGVQELVSDVSEDGSYVYFVATGVLAEGGVSGSYNLYLLHDTGNGWTTAYVATLSKEDDMDWYAENFGAPILQHISSRVSPNGRYLVFMSNRSLTGYDNKDALSGERDEEVYEYDAQTGKLVCASCDPTGARPVGIYDDGSPQLVVDAGGVFGFGAGYNDIKDGRDGERFYHRLAGSVPGWDQLANISTYQPRYLSDSGRMFFDSPDGLVPQDTNKLEDVYEYEPEGIGGCTGSTFSATVLYEKELAGRPVEGCVGLVSSGTSSTESAFYDASENGDDVFFDTTAQLSSEDHDKSYDLYDAHVCTGEVPCRTSPVSAPPCDSGDSCKAAPSPQPAIFGAPASATFSGAGNVTPSPLAPAVKPKAKVVTCKKGYTKNRKSKCIKTKKKTKAKKSAHTNRRAN